MPSKPVLMFCLQQTNAYAILKGRRIALIVITNPTWRVLRKYLDRITAAVQMATPGSYAEVEIPFR